MVPSEMKKLLLIALIPIFTQCGGGFGGTSVSKSPAVLNVSGWDPKEIQRGGDKYSQYNVSALRKNVAKALIARSAKGPLLDDKFGDFMKSADREGMLLGAYHFVTMNQDPAAQADSFVSRVKAVARAKGISQNRILLVGDFDTNSTPDRLVKFITRVHERTGVYPVTYLENSDGLRARTSQCLAGSEARHTTFAVLAGTLRAGWNGADDVTRRAAHSRQPDGPLRCLERLDDVAIRRRHLGKWRLRAPSTTTPDHGEVRDSSEVCPIRWSAMSLKETRVI